MGSQLSQSALVAFSGGQDSSTILAWALSRYERVETVGFSYGQKHAIELDCRANVRRKISALSTGWLRRLGVDHLVALDLIGQLSGLNIETSEGDANRVLGDLGVGQRYIPGRNMMMLSMCSSVAFRRGIRTIVYGVSETEYSGYPDCRDVSIKAIEAAINLSTGLKFEIAVPLMSLSKADVWKLAYELGGRSLVSIIVNDSHTCYEGVRDVYNEWGYGCGRCAACQLRAKGWSEFKTATIEP